MHRISLLALALVVSMASSASAQQIRGTVTDAVTSEPVEAAFLTATTLDGTPVAAVLTDATGAFVLRVTAGDSLLLRVERMDYAILESVPLAVAASDPLELDIRLRPQPISLGEVEVVERRLRSGFGYYLDADDVSRISASSANQVVARLPYAMPIGDGVMVSRRGATTRLSARSEDAGLCEPTIYVDGSYRDIPADQLNAWVPASSIRAVELYRDYHALPQYTLPDRENCAILLIWTNYALGGGASPEWPWSTAENSTR